VYGYMAKIDVKAPGSSTWETFGATGGPGTVTLSGSRTFNTSGVWSVRVVDMPSGSTRGSTTFTILPATTPTTFSLNTTTFTYTGSAQGPTVVATPNTATFTTGGTLSATNVDTYTATATATGNYAGSNSALIWTIAKASQTIAFASISEQTYGTPLTLNATASSGLPVTYSVSGPATISGNAVTFTGTGSVTITAAQAGGSNYTEAPSVSQTFNVQACPATFSLNQTVFVYTGSSQGPTVVASPSGATFSTGGTLSATAIGTYTATATASGGYSGSNTALVWTICAGSVPVAPLEVFTPTR